MSGLEKQIADLGTNLNTRLDRIDLTLRTKQIDDAGRFATIEVQVEQTADDNNSLGKKIRSHESNHAQWILYPVGAVAGILGLAEVLRRFL